MDALIVTSLIIPAIVAFVLIALLIKERYNLLPKQNYGTRKQDRFSDNNQNLTNNYNYQRNGSRDYLDFSGGTMGI
ncbi:MAG: hypothetical protein IPG89_10715 [Bacteroidetes bacterium]|nr:hypothetical protein [Bacteroidota bacterium]